MTFVEDFKGVLYVKSLVAGDLVSKFILFRASKYTKAATQHYVSEFTRSSKHVLFFVVLRHVLIRYASVRHTLRIRTE
jgi:hypothetical protein